MPPALGMQMDGDNRLRFHSRCGTLVKLSTNGRSAKRLRALDEFNNGVVMTNRSIFDDELFEVSVSWEQEPENYSLFCITTICFITEC